MSLQADPANHESSPPTTASLSRGASIFQVLAALLCLTGVAFLIGAEILARFQLSALEFAQCPY